ncbi:MAG: hypothetical protein DMF28_03155, partial [Verrucomicrobia bacterium]
VTPTNEIISRRFGSDMLRHIDPCLMDPLRHGLAATEKYRAKQKSPSEQKVNGVLHFFDGHPFMQLCAGRNCNLRTSANSKFEFGNPAKRKNDIRAPSFTIHRFSRSLNTWLDNGSII